MLLEMYSNKGHKLWYKLYLQSSKVKTGRRKSCWVRSLWMQRMLWVNTKNKTTWFDLNKLYLVSISFKILVMVGLSVPPEEFMISLSCLSSALLLWYLSFNFWFLLLRSSSFSLFLSDSLFFCSLHFFTACKNSID